MFYCIEKLEKRKLQIFSSTIETVQIFVLTLKPLLWPLNPRRCASPASAPAHCPPRALAYPFSFPKSCLDLGCLEKGSLGPSLSPVARMVKVEFNLILLKAHLRFLTAIELFYASETLMLPHAFKYCCWVWKEFLKIFHRLIPTPNHSILNVLFWFCLKESCLGQRICNDTFI